jgi:flagellar motor switch protein FliN
MPIKNEAAKVHLVTCFADALQSSIDAKQDGQWFCAASTKTRDAKVVIEDPRALMMRIRLRGTLSGELGIELREDGLSLFEPGESEPLRDTWQQIMEGVIQRLPKRAIDAGTFAFSVESCDLVEPSGQYVQIGKIELSQPDHARCALRVLADDELIESFRAAEWNVSRTAARDDAQPAALPELERVIEVPLRVTLRFGQRNMRLREVLELNTGALVELDRQVEDPVDLILDERVIARGEVVIVDGNYGLRVTEIVERPSMAVR